TARWGEVHFTHSDQFGPRSESAGVEPHYIGASAMTRFVPSLTPLAIVCLLTAVPAHAQRAFVSGAGIDANTCGFAAPCRTAQHAHDILAPGGEIVMLDPAGYGALTINKAISIQGNGWGELVAVNGANAVTINAGAQDKVQLRGLRVEGFGTGGT